MPARPFDAVLIVSFGGPRGMDDVRPFLANVLRGRRVSPERLEEVAHHYALFGGVSPITELTLRQAEGLRRELRRAGPDLPVYVGMRNWDPYLSDALAQMSRDGVRRAVGFITAAHKSYSSCGQYKANVADARAELRAKGLADVEVSFVGDWFAHEQFVTANAARLVAALRALPEDLRGGAEVAFTAHSIPTPMAEKSRYRENLAECCAKVMSLVGPRPWSLVYQSRSGRPEDPWLGPDINDWIRERAAAGVRAVAVSPVGFVCDHVEVLYDLDHEARQTAQGLGVAFARAGAVNDDARFAALMGEVVREHVAAHASRPRLPLVGNGPERPEGPPPARR